jgi:hypothetical protein
MAVNPPSGNQSTSFEFSVTYTDLDGNAPVSIAVVINGTGWTLSKATISDNNYIDGCLYRRTMPLAPGCHVYYFTTSDGRFTATTLSSIHFVSSPTVPSNPNPNPPGLSNPVVNAPSGNMTSTFEFRVNYSDPDNNAPASLVIIINGTAFSMVKIVSNDTNFVDGCQYGYNCTLSAGTYIYFFCCSDGAHTTTSMVFQIEVGTRNVTNGDGSTTIQLFIVSIAVIGVVSTTTVIAISRRVKVKKFKSNALISGQSAMSSAIDDSHVLVPHRALVHQVRPVPSPSAGNLGTSGGSLLVRDIVSSIEKARRLMQHDIADYTETECIDGTLDFLDASVASESDTDVYEIVNPPETVAPALTDSETGNCQNIDDA